IAPSLAPFFFSWYSGFDFGITNLQGVEGIHRLFGMRHYGFISILLLCSYYSPITLFDPRRGRFYVMVTSGVSILAAGYRNLILWGIAALGISGLFHRRWRELVAGGIVAAALIAALAFGQGRFYDLPMTIQRSLAFLPGRWSDLVVSDTEGSSTF